MLVETIEDRGYVKCRDVEGTTTKITEFVLTEQTIRAAIKEKTFGAQKKKLVIQPIGIMTIEFLTAHFAELFSYDYTKHMEMELDAISKGDQIWHELCDKCNQEIKQWMKPVAKTIKKEVFEIVQGEPEEGCSKYVVSVGQYGPVLKRKVGDKLEYRPIKRGISLDMTLLKTGKYNLDDLMEVNMNLGEYEGSELMIKDGRYGAYVQWGEKRESLKDIGIRLEELEREDIVKYLQNKQCSVGSLSNNNNGTRILNDHVSIRVGKYGPYIYYKMASMKKPAFYPMKKCPLKYTDCDTQVLLDWINTTYQLNEKIQV
jgi:DNA topoisomerase-1